MKKVKAISVAAILFSSMMLGTTVTSPILSTTTAHADQVKMVHNKIIYTSDATHQQATVGQQDAYGPVGYAQALTVPTGYALADSNKTTIPLIDGTNPRQYVKVVKTISSKKVFTSIKYVNSVDNRVVQIDKLAGRAGDRKSLTAPDLYTLDNANDATYTLAEGTEYRIVYVTPIPLASGEAINTVKYRIGNEAGYRLAPGQSTLFFIEGRPTTHVAEVIRDADAMTTKINFVDQATNKIVTTTSLDGNIGQTLNIDFPSNYSPVNSEDSQITLNPRVTEQTILVKAGSSESSSASSTASLSKTSDFRGSIMIKSSQGAAIYNNDGKLTTRQVLPAYSSWASDKKMTIDGTNYYRVSTNGWIKESSALEYNGTNQTITTNAQGRKQLFASNGANDSRSIAANSAWYTDRSAIINGVKMYRVSTNEWVKASDLK
ncbi:SLAP domain-containing protein [Companilactobacillus versmoldensis]|uniref:S-layer protein C-terminal domain-containing protein n=1 Tax=Companilactobacillus versmoldensis DSM 14857 = KCTC 3814 TaxID=1423815 RepID=A0A0R1SEA5_9LACO|nr:SLAP domain-containing protein [Companilactobacillus versmoldensis]KRL67456.1 hypothetical protein FC27_GL001772 [Companilactobacillus versmoldensis DSM 14857 = KCTC 3814]